MIAVFKREFVTAFQRVYGVAVTAVSCFAVAVLFVLYNLTYTTDSIGVLLSAMSLLEVLLIPCFACMAFRDKKGQDTDAHLRALPIGDIAIFTGKFLAVLALSLIPVLFATCLIPVSAIYGAYNISVSFSSVAGLVLFTSAYSAVCTFIASMSRSRALSFVWCYCLGIAWYFSNVLAVLVPLSSVASLIAFAVLIVLLAALLWYLSKSIVLASSVGGATLVALTIFYLADSGNFAKLFEKFINKLSIFKRFSVFSAGIFDIEAIIYFSCIIGLFFFLGLASYVRNGAKREGFVRHGFVRVTSFALALVVFAAATVTTFAVAAVPDAYTKIDVTEEHKNSLSKSAKDFLKSVDKDVTIYVLESTGAEDYDYYLSQISACNRRIDIEYVYYRNDPSFYTTRGLDPASISANSLVVQCGDKYEYLSYVSMFSYSNQTLGFSNISHSDYAYYYNLFASSEQYAEYLSVLVANTVMYFDADKHICSYIEYVAADIIPANYYLTGHGETDITLSTNPYATFGFKTLDLSSGAVPKDAAAIFINMPTKDINDAEKQLLLSYLAQGGQLTFVTDTNFIEFPNFMSVLSAYGMTSDGKVVFDEVTASDGSVKFDTQFTANVHFDNDIMAYADNNNYYVAPILKDAYGISMNEDASPSLILIPLLSSSEKSYVDGNVQSAASRVLACAAETSNGGRVVWLTGGKAYGTISTYAPLTAIMAFSWVTLEFESKVQDLPSVLYAQPSVAITDAGAKITAGFIIALPVVFALVSGVIIYKRKKEADNIALNVEENKI